MSLLSPEVLNLVDLWLRWDANPETREEITKLVSEKDEEELRKRLSVRIAFGTAGLRGSMKAGFSCMNDLTVIQASQGLSKYLLTQFPNAKDRGVIIGYDGRHHSKRFAELSAATFISEDYVVYLCSRLVPTPFVSFATPHLNCVSGIMVTASHNPKEDNGYKVYWETGCQIKEPHDKGISKLIEMNLEPWKINHDLLLQTSKGGLLRDATDVVAKAYFEQISSRYCFHKLTNPNTPIPITYTPMHGVGAEWVTKSFAAFHLPPYVPVLKQIEPDGDFPTVAFPNPEEGKGALKLAFETADSINSPVVIANDPDADRLAVAEKQKDGQWKIFTGNEIGALLAHWAWENFQIHHPSESPSKCVMINSTVSSKLLRSMALKEGFNYEETLTGFKWLGGMAHQKEKEGYHCLFAFEEAIGFLFGTTTLDKDGVNSAAVFAEMASQLYLKGSTVQDKLSFLYGKYGHFVTRNRYFFCYDPVKLVAIFKAIRNFENSGSYPTQMGPYKVQNVRDLTVGYDSSTADKKPLLPTSTSTQMITFTFENGCVATLRGSGTEPKLKYYIELNGENRDVVEKTLDDMTLFIIETCLKPKENGLLPPQN